MCKPWIESVRKFEKYLCKIMNNTRTEGKQVAIQISTMHLSTSRKPTFRFTSVHYLSQPSAKHLTQVGKELNSPSTSHNSITMHYSPDALIAHKECIMGRSNPFIWLKKVHAWDRSRVTHAKVTVHSAEKPAQGQNRLIAENKNATVVVGITTECKRQRWETPRKHHMCPQPAFISLLLGNMV